MFVAVVAHKGLYNIYETKCHYNSSCWIRTELYGKKKIAALCSWLREA